MSPSSSDPSVRDDLPSNRRTGAFERRVAAALARHAPPRGPIVVACSGGPDSTAALVALARTAEAPIVAASFDHRLRPREETEADTAFVATLAARLGLDMRCGAPEAPLPGDEATARHARYRWLHSVLAEAGADTLVTGHTRDDQAETVLLNLARGAGIHGAAGIRPQAAWPLPLDPPPSEAAPASEAAPRILRPLLDLARAEIEDYLDALHLTPRLDPTNELTTYARNRVRHEAIPVLEAINPAARHHLAAFATRAADADAALDAWAAAVLADAPAPSGDVACIDRRRLAELPVAVAGRVLARSAATVGLALDAAQQQTLLQLATRRGAHLDLAGGHAGTSDRWLRFKAAGAGGNREPGTLDVSPREG